MDTLVSLYIEQLNQLNEAIMNLHKINVNGSNNEQIKRLNKEREELENKIYKLNNPEETIADKFDNYNNISALKYALVLYRNTIKNEEERQWIYNILGDSWFNLIYYLEDKDNIINIESLCKIYNKVCKMDDEYVKAKYLEATHN